MVCHSSGAYAVTTSEDVPCEYEGRKLKLNINRVSAETRCCGLPPEEPLRLQLRVLRMERSHTTCAGPIHGRNGFGGNQARQTHCCIRKKIHGLNPNEESVIRVAHQVHIDIDRSEIHNLNAVTRCSSVFCVSVDG